MKHKEKHRTHRIGWLRAAVLGANDGILSTASLVIGVAASGASHDSVLVAGVAGMVAGAMSMAAGEYVSVCSQADTENADLTTEKSELESDPDGELEELTQIYVDRGLDTTLAKQVAIQLTARDALATHARDEIGISAVHIARPVQAALTSAASFAVGAALPLISAFIMPNQYITIFVAASSFLFLAILGALGAYTGGASIRRAALRVMFWGAIAMAATAGVGALFGIST